MKNTLRILFVFGLVSLHSYGQEAYTVDQSLQYALENNVNVKKAKIDREIASQKVKETTGIGLPQLDAQASYNYYINIPVQLLPAEIAGGQPGTFVPVRFGQKQSASGGLTLTQLLFNGSYLVGLQSAKAYKETAALVEEKTEISVKEAILMSYAAVVVTDENLKTLEENRKIAEKILKDTKEVYRIGLIEEQNVEQLEYNFKTLVVNIENLKRTREKLVMTLKYVMGYPLEQKINLLTSLEELIDKNRLLLNPTDEVNIENHIDMRLKANSVKLSELQLKFQKSKALPTLSGFLTSSYNAYSNTFTFLREDQRYFNTSLAGLQLNVPIFSGFQRHWQTEQAKLELSKSVLDKNETERKLKSEYFEKTLEYNNALDSYQSAKDLIALSSNIYRKQQIKFKEGLGSSFDLQNSENQLYNSQSSLYQAAINLIQSKVALDKAKGDL